jgi:aminopeptidase N
MKKHTCCLVLSIVLIGMATLPPVPRSGFASTGSLDLRRDIENELSGGDWTLRKKTLLDYSTYVGQANDVSLREFRGGDDAASRSIGQGKTALVLHLLKRTAGNETFSRSAGKLLAEPRTGRITWDDVRMVFEKEGGRDLGWFFQQWVDRKGLPNLRAENGHVRRNGSAFEVSFDLIQQGDVYTLEIPVFISFTSGGSKADSVKIDAGKKHVTLLVDDEPSAVVLDQDYDVPQRLTEDETPPVLAKVLREGKPLLVLPVAGAGLYAGVIDQWKQRAAELREADSIKSQETGTADVIVLGRDNPLISRLYGNAGLGEGELNLAARKNPWNPDALVVMVEARTAHAADETLRVLSASGDCSSLSIDQDGRMVRKTDESERGIRMYLREEPTALDVSALTSITKVIEGAAGRKIVYVGEYHDRFAHHAVELQVIKTLFRKNASIAIGMEMFQRPFQGALDDYVRGAINEREFLKKSEYFSRWGFDYNLYKPILDFARAEKIPVVALNLRRELADKVAREGVGALTAEEKKEIPLETDFSDSAYRDRLMRVFAEHKGSSERNFEFFYQAQVLWDETMAFSIDEYLKKNPGRQMVVLAGSGHLAYGSGIPKRVFRRNGYEHATILNDAAVDREIADYLVFPEALEGVTSPKLMVILKESGGKIVITDLPENSVSSKAGIRTGDRIVSIDGDPVQTMDDVKIALFYKKQEDTVTVGVLRKRFLIGEKELKFAVKLP